MAPKRGLVLAKEAVDTSGSVGQDFIAHRTPGLDNSDGADGACQVAVEDQPGKYCDQDLDGGTVGGYGPQVIDAVYTLAFKRGKTRSEQRRPPGSGQDLRGDQVRRVGWRFRGSGHRGPG